MVGNQESTILEKRYPDTAPGTTAYKDGKKLKQHVTTSGEVEIIDGMIIGNTRNVFSTRTNPSGRRPVSAIP